MGSKSPVNIVRFAKENQLDLLHGSIYIKFKTWQTSPVLLKVRRVVTLRVYGLGRGTGTPSFHCGGNILHGNLGSSVCMCQRLCVHVKMQLLCCVCNTAISKTFLKMVVIVGRGYSTLRLWSLDGSGCLWRMVTFQNYRDQNFNQDSGSFAVCGAVPEVLQSRVTLTWTPRYLKQKHISCSPFKGMLSFFSLCKSNSPISMLLQDSRTSEEACA